MSCAKTSPYAASGRRISLQKTQPGDVGEESHTCVSAVFPLSLLGEALVRAREGVWMAVFTLARNHGGRVVRNNR